MRDLTPEQRRAPGEVETPAAALDLLQEADDLLWIASDAMFKMGLRNRGSDWSLPNEVRQFALEFSNEGRDGPGTLQVTGTGRYRAWLVATRNLGLETGRLAAKGENL